MTNIEHDTIANDDYRRVLFTGRHLQLVLMSIPPGEEIGLETHMEHDQFIRVEAGTGVLMLGSQRYELADGVAVVIPGGTEHNVSNASLREPLRLYTLYSPPEHADGSVHRTKADEPAEH
jgi:mannose-6-phosphate isomerase-like protein (cupin superfamily)